MNSNEPLTREDAVRIVSDLEDDFYAPVIARVLLELLPDLEPRRVAQAVLRAYGKSEAEVPG